MSKEMIKIKVEVSTGFAGCDHEDDHEIEKSKWDGMPSKQQDKYLDDLATELLENSVSAGAWVMESES